MKLLCFSNFEQNLLLNQSIEVGLQQPVVNCSKSMNLISVMLFSRAQAQVRK